MVFEFANLSLSKEKLNMIGPNDSKEILSASIYWLRVLTVDSDQDRLQQNYANQNFQFMLGRF